MRPDMFKVVVERERRGLRYKTPKGEKRRIHNSLRQGTEESHEKIDLKWSLSSDRRKELSEHLKPLYRFLVKNIGRKWDDVFSEICEHINQNSAVQSHVRDHVWDYVEKDVILVDGNPHEKAKIHSFRDNKSSDNYGYPIYSYSNGLTMYVCPLTGLLKQAPMFSYSKKTPPTIYLWKSIETLEQYMQIDEIWYLVQLAAIPYQKKMVFEAVVKGRTRNRTHYWAREHIAPVEKEYYYDCILKEIVAVDGFRFKLHERSKKYGGNYYAVSKRQISSREIKEVVKLKAKLIKDLEKGKSLPSPKVA